MKSELSVSVVNVGEAPAENVEVVTRINGEIMNTQTIARLEASETYRSLITVNTRYKEATIVTVEAACFLGADSKIIILNAVFPRSFSESLCCSFVTPNDKNLIELKNRILNDKNPLTPNWIAFRDWIGNNVEYKIDYEVHGENEDTAQDGGLRRLLGTPMLST